MTWLRVIRSTSRSFGLLRYSSMYLISLNVVWIVVALTPDLALWLVPDR
ncbi:TRAP c4-dicarboxylate transport system permease DctM subunit [Sulfitobacter mediterraneus KCTC 32188]|nr:TRAP c4-dicarboxylate transport system permease DctM subunit [Sulfitobacter mediterraneus KCTC 32188]